jgi:Pyruvate/2-oxoacid:ferredoxin oxidoreductase gamma subunit
MANVVMLGTMSTLLPISQEVLLETLKARIPEKYRAPNLEAFSAGIQAMKEPAS